jgi:hypothetical protein
MTTKIPDSVELSTFGLSSETRYLGSPSVVEDVLKMYLASINAIRQEQLHGVPIDVQAKVTEQAKRMQSVFYGHSSAFTYTPWFSVDHLGRALVEKAKLGGDRGDAVYRLFLHIACEYLTAYVAFESDRMSDEDFQKVINRILRLYMHVLLASG